MYPNKNNNYFILLYSFIIVLICLIFNIQIENNDMYLITMSN